MVEQIKRIFDLLNTIEYFKTIDNKGELAQKLFNAFDGDMDIVKELMRMELWLDINPKKRKKSYSKFIFNWCNRTIQRKSNYSKFKNFDKRYRDGEQKFKPTKDIDE